MITEEPKEPFKSDGCTGIPNLWFKHCCKDHDYAHWAGHPELEGDINFNNCLIESSPFLGSFKFLFAGFMVTGMATFRPAYRFYQRLAKAFLSWRNKL